MLHTIGGSSDSLVVMTSFVVSHFCCSNPTSLLPHYLPIKKKKKFVTYIKKLHTIGTNLFVLTCFISTLVRIVGLDPARGHSKLDYLSYSLKCSSLTFEGVRRLLEKDLGLETYDLDVHKRFIKQCLVKVSI